MAKGKKRGIAVAVVVVVVLVVSFITYQVAPPDSKTTVGQQQNASEIEYTKTDSTQDYVRDGKECIGYYVAVSPDATEDQLKQAFKEITEGDGYYLHTVYFCSDVSKANGTGFDVAMVEEESEGADPVVTKAV